MARAAGQGVDGHAEPVAGDAHLTSIGLDGSDAGFDVRVAEAFFEREFLSAARLVRRASGELDPRDERVVVGKVAVGEALQSSLAGT